MVGSEFQVLVWSATVILGGCQEILTTTRCLGAGYTQMNIGCPQGTLIQVIKALAAKTRGSPRSDFCLSPGFELMDCVLYEQQLTEEFRTSCNRFGNCRRLSPYADLEECGDAFHFGVVYQHIEYQCLPGARAAQAVSSEVTVTSGSLIEVYTPSYPSAWYTMMAVSCNITLPPNVELHLQLLEFTHNTEDICPFMLWVDASKPYCAKKAGQYDALTLGPFSWGGNEQLKLRTAIDKPVPVKLWLKVTAKEPEWQKNDHSWVSATQITCQQHMDTMIMPLPVPPAVNAEATTTKQEILKQEIGDSVNGTKENTTYIKTTKRPDIRVIAAGVIAGVVTLGLVIVLPVVFLYLCKRKLPSGKHTYENDSVVGAIADQMSAGGREDVVVYEAAPDTPPDFHPAYENLALSSQDPDQGMVNSVYQQATYVPPASPPIYTTLGSEGDVIQNDSEYEDVSSPIRNTGP